MAGDLVAADIQVEAQAVLRFWFDLASEQHFAKDPALDARIADRFGALRDAVLTDGAAGWRDDPDTLLAAIVLLDQFSRNMHRGRAEAFAGDELALALTRHAIAQGWEDRYPVERRVFLYLPLMHGESMALQALSVDKFFGLGDPEGIRYAVAHRYAIRRFGRFPGRNAALGRETTAAEQAWLDTHDGGW